MVRNTKKYYVIEIKKKQDGMHTYNVGGFLKQSRNIIIGKIKNKMESMKWW
jgi:hypothetical protein